MNYPNEMQNKYTLLHENSSDVKAELSDDIENVKENGMDFEQPNTESDIKLVKINQHSIYLSTSEDVINCAIKNGHSTEEAVNIANARMAYAYKNEKMRKNFKYI